MDFQWRTQLQQSEQHQLKKMPKLQFDNISGSSSVLPFFVPTDPNSHFCNLTPFPDSSSPTVVAAASASASSSARFSRMGSHFTLAQWQELELQALIFRYMVAGAAVPNELLQPIKKSLIHALPYFLHPLQHFQPSLLQSGYWGKASMDPEPGRCRRTDGKKWRCSRDVVAGQKYCERHMHRGRNRSRKHVEVPTTIDTSGGVGKIRFPLSDPEPSIDLLHLNQSSSDFSTENKTIFESQNDMMGVNRSDGRILRRFFDDWPRSLEEPGVLSNSSSLNSSTCLSISMPGNSPSDVSLKLSTGDEMSEDDRQRENWGTEWGSNQASSMGGPLAEALRSSALNSSPTSVLHKLSRGSVTEASFVST